MPERGISLKCDYEILRERSHSRDNDKDDDDNDGGRKFINDA